MDTSPPPTHLPYDILALVVKESVNDPSTLSAWCRTSFSMLELATPLLYSKIQFNDRKAYSDLFSQPVSLLSATLKEIDCRPDSLQPVASPSTQPFSC